MKSLSFIPAMVFVNHYLAFDHFSSVWYPFSEVQYIVIVFLMLHVLDSSSVEPVTHITCEYISVTQLLNNLFLNTKIS